MDRKRRIPEATVARLPVYLRTLLEVQAEAMTTISSERLAELAGVNAAKVRKDLSYLGSYGTRGVGYDVDHLLVQMSRELGLTRDWPVAIVGVGNLGAALANYGGFGDRGFPVAALVDADPSKIGTMFGGHKSVILMIFLRLSKNLELPSASSQRQLPAHRKSPIVSLLRESRRF